MAITEEKRQYLKEYRRRNFERDKPKARERYFKNREKRLAQSKAWRELHKGEIRQKKLKDLQEYPKKVKEIKKCSNCNERNGRGKRNLCRQCWRIDHDNKNRDKIRIQQRANFLKNREHRIALTKAWQQKHPYPKYKEYPEKRKWQNGIRKNTRIKYPLDGKMCQFCPNKSTTHHHYTEPMQIDYFWYVCKTCHSKIHYPHIHGELNTSLLRGAVK